MMFDPVADERSAGSRPPLARHARTAPTAAVLTLTLLAAAASWLLAISQMNGMDMGVATGLGSFGFFLALWVSMMAAMMLPGAIPAMLRHAGASGLVRAAPTFAGSYLAVWALVGVAVYVLYRPHGVLAAGVITVAAGVYELTPLKQHFRQRCRESVGSGIEFGLNCVGSSIGLMLMLVVLAQARTRHPPMGRHESVRRCQEPVHRADPVPRRRLISHRPIPAG